jgi:hypothetical protein
MRQIRQLLSLTVRILVGKLTFANFKSIMPTTEIIVKARTKLASLIKKILKLLLKLIQRSTLMKPLTINLKTLVKPAVKTSKKLLRKPRAGLINSRQLMKFLML